ncbi:hypothetical protein [Polaribacter sp. BAL334]|uniref:hypothetical protein n=1 Tax=Polaribacter sp. BAL334 TaxID=1708178 RepID=UPI00293D5C3D|nr:hypothetical protein [Polaribacter sp. BAL334]
MKIPQFISVILHPIVIPTVGLMLYFLVSPINFETSQKLSVLSLVFVITYLIPLLILVLFKKFKLIDSYKTETIHDRKLPVAIMIVVFYLLGNTLNYIPNLNEVALLFYATSLGLILIYMLFYFQMKASIHLLSFGIFTGFFMVLSTIHSQSYLMIIILHILLSGIVASARLHLNAHTPKEIYIGFFIGLLAPIFTNILL